MKKFKTLKEPLSLRLSDKSNPERGRHFSEVLSRKRANAADVLRGLADAYIASCGSVDFPVKLVPADGRAVKKKVRRRS